MRILDVKSMDLKEIYKMLYILGAFLLGCSFFFQFFHFHIYNGKNGILLDSWAFNPFGGWVSSNPQFNLSSYNFEDNFINTTSIIAILLLICIAISIYSVLFSDFEKKEFNSVRSYIYVRVVILALNFYFIFILPVVNAFSYDIYFPYVIVNNRDIGLIFESYIGIGYILQIIGFICIFPYTLFGYMLTLQFQDSDEEVIRKKVEKAIEQKQKKAEFILDRIINEETIKAEHFQKKHKNHLYKYR